MAHSPKQKTVLDNSAALDAARQRLVGAFLKGKTDGFMEAHSLVIDEYLQKSFEMSLAGPMMDIIGNPYAMIALGGYGRQEQCLYSDIDLLFLFKKKVPPAAEELIREVVYPLWDLGFEVGYATRSLKECISMAAQDFEVLTSLLDARFICGVSLLFSDLMEMLRKKILFRKSAKVVNWLLERNTERHRLFGDSSYLLEPNLKDGQGGLRDYHTMLWIGRIKYEYKQVRDFEYYGHLSHDEFSAFQKSLQFIWTVRSLLHHAAGRKCDQLHLEYQGQLTEHLGYRQINGQKPVERFLGELHGNMEFVKQRYLIYLHEQGYPRKKRAGRKPAKTMPADGIEIRKEALDFSSPEKILEKPFLLIKIFEDSARLKMPLSAEAGRLIREFGYLVDDGFRASSEVVKSFETILLTPSPVFNVLDAMLDTGFLFRLIPEFKNLANRIQYTEYHIYPADKHSIRTVQTIKNFGSLDDASGDPFCGLLYKGIRNRKRLLWAALLHDIGKGEESDDHSERGALLAETILGRFGYKKKEIELIAFLVRHHLLLVKIATRRDLNDEATSILCAREVKEPKRLGMLYLLTVADSIATGPKAWSDWTALLLRELFLKVLGTLERGELASAEAVNIIEGKMAEILDSAETPEEQEENARMFEVLSPRYFLYMPAEFIRQHLELYRRLGDREFVWEIKQPDNADTRTVIICAKDRPGLFSKIAGVLTLNGIDILDAQIFTWRNNIALDIFEVSPPPDQIFEQERWARAEENLKAVLTGELDAGATLERRIKTYRPKKPRISMSPNRVVIDNDGSSFYSIVEVFTDDFPGLLFCITDALYRCGLDIWVAKIATKLDQVVDVFYVRDFDGQKVTDPEKVAQIESTVLKALPGGSRKKLYQSPDPSSRKRSGKSHIRR